MPGQRARQRDRRPARLPGQERREHFLEVASEIVREHGVDAVTMESVAAAAGVSKGLGYAYFTNRGDLLLAVLERELSDFQRRINDAIRSADTYEGKVRGAIRTWFDVLVERGGLLGTLLQAGPVQNTLQGRRNASYRQFEEFWGSMAEAELGVPKERAVAAAAVLIAGMQGLLERWTEAGDSRQMLEDVYVELTMRGMTGLAQGTTPAG